MQAMGQQDTKLTQSMFMIPSFNPGAVGQSDKICAGLDLRNQMMSFPGAPKVVEAYAHMPFSFLGRTHGVGINFTNDNIALNNEIYGSLAYSYKLDIGSGILGIGASAGFTQFSVAYDKFNTGDDGITTDDIAIPGDENNHFGFDLDFGLFYSTDNLYAGYSTTHINRANIKFDSLAGNQTFVKLVNHHYLTAGYTIQLADPMFELMPSFLIQSDLKSHNINFSTLVRYNKKFWGGVSYTVGGAGSVLLGAELMNGINVGLSYDIEFSRLISYNWGSLEVSIRYCFDLSLDKSPKKYESIRFL